MSINIAEAFKAPFGKRMTVLHFILGAILLIIPFAQLIVLGAMIKYIGAVRKGQEADFSIMDDMKDSFVVGFKYLVGGLLLVIPLILIIVIGSMLADSAGGIAVLLTTMITFVLYLIYAVFSVALITNFSLDKKVLSIVDFSRAFFLIKGNVKGYIFTIIFCIAAAIPYSILFSIPIVNLSALVLGIPYLMTINHLYGQFLRENKAVDVLNNVYHFDN